MPSALMQIHYRSKVRLIFIQTVAKQTLTWDQVIKENETILEGSQRLPDEATIFQAELMVIRIKMLDLPGHLDEQDQFVKLFTNSRAAIQVLNNSSVTSQLVKDTVNAPCRG